MLVYIRYNGGGDMAQTVGEYVTEMSQIMWDYGSYESYFILMYPDDTLDKIDQERFRAEGYYEAREDDTYKARLKLIYQRLNEAYIAVQQRQSTPRTGRYGKPIFGFLREPHTFQRPALHPSTGPLNF